MYFTNKKKSTFAIGQKATYFEGPELGSTSFQDSYTNYVISFFMFSILFS